MTRSTRTWLFFALCLIQALYVAPQVDEASPNDDPDYYEPGSPTEDCVCVPLYQCVDGKVVTDGSNILDPRKLPKPNQGGIEEERDEKEIEAELAEELKDEMTELKESGVKECGPYHICCGPTEEVEVTIPPIPFEHKCGTRNTVGINGRVLNSEKSGNSEFGEFPWQAAILKKEGDEDYVFKCGGTLIDEKHILTIAHCVKPFMDDRVSLVVRLGEWDLESLNKDEVMEHENHDVSDIIIHPKYKANNLHNDVAILELADEVVFKPHIDTACLPKEKDDFTGQECTVTGWGVDQFENGVFSPILKEVTVPVLGNKQCQEMLRKTRLGRFFKLHEGFLCAGSQEGVDTCKGDGGGPLVCLRSSDKTYTLAGLVSWGIDCGQPNVPGVYVNVKKYVDWISSVTGKRLEDYWSV